jgi:hypothetical protein
MTVPLVRLPPPAAGYGPKPPVATGTGIAAWLPHWYRPYRYPPH